MRRDNDGGATSGPRRALLALARAAAAVPGLVVPDVRIEELALSAEFQGFARDLHDEVADAVLRQVERESKLGGRLLRDLLGEGRAIDHGNVRPKNLAKDFRRFDLELWDVMEARDRRTSARREKLEELMDRYTVSLPARYVTLLEPA